MGNDWERFELIAQAGAGGMARVYRARDRDTGDEVAVKILKRASEADRFEREAQVLAELTDPTIVRYIAHGKTATGEPYLAMEWLEGEDLQARLARGPLSAADATQLALRIAGALAVAHRRGVIHRDIKPSNVFLPDGAIDRAKVLDFGIARWATDNTSLTTTGVVIGTPAFMSPEQARGEREIDARTDVFALGSLLYECLTGKPTFEGASPIAVLSKILFEDVPRVSAARPDVPPSLDQLISDLLAKDAAARPADGAAVVAALATIAAAPAPGDGAGDTLRAPRIGSSEQRFLGVLLTRPPLGTVSAAALSEIRQTVDGFAGILESLVDGSLLVAIPGGEATALDRVCQAARCALALRRILPAAPTVLAMGRADVTASLGVGEVMDNAARLIGDMPAGADIRLDDATAAMLEGRFGIRRGAVNELLGEASSGDTGRTLLGRRTPFVGRQREIDVMTSWFDECVSEPRACAVVVTAPPGVGKSRLAREFAHQAGSRGAHIWSGHGDPTRTGAPLGLLAPLVRRAMGIRDGEPLAERQAKLSAYLATRIAPAELEHTTTFLAEVVSAPWPPDQRPLLAAARRDPKVLAEHMRRAFCTWLAAECDAAPVVLLLDDLHWGDLPTVKFIEFALRELDDRPLFVVALARPEVDQQFPRLWANAGVLELRLSGLTRSASEQLVAEYLPAASGDAKLAGRIIQQASGNAFFLEELIRAASSGGIDTLPDTVLAMATNRLERLSDEARRVVRAASVFGEVFWLGGVSALLGPDEAAGAADVLRDLVGRELVSARLDARFADEVEYSFRHGLVRDAAYAMLTDADRQLGHRLAGAWLAAAGESQAAVVAQHFDQGDDAASARDWYVRAAAQALEANDFHTVLAFAARAIELGASGDRLREAHELRGSAFMALGMWADAPAELRAALALVDDSALAQRVQVHLKLAQACFFAFDLDQVRDHAEAALALLDGLDRGDLMAEATAALGVYQEAAGDLAAARDAYAVARHQARGSYFPSEAQLLMALLWLGDVDASIERGRAFVDQARAMNDIYALLVALPQVALSLVARGRYLEAERLFAETRTMGTAYGTGPLVARSVAMSAGYRLDVLDFAGADQVAREAQEMARSATYPPTTVSTGIDLLASAARAGDPGRAERDLPSVAEAVERSAGKGWHGWLFKLRFTSACAEIALAKGDAAGALSHADDLIAQCAACGRAKYRVIGNVLRGQSLVSLGQREAGLASLVLAGDHARRLDDPALRLRAGLARLDVDGSDELVAELRAVATAMRDNLPDAMRERFAANPAIRRVLG